MIDFIAIKIKWFRSAFKIPNPKAHEYNIKINWLRDGSNSISDLTMITKTIGKIANGRELYE